MERTGERTYERALPRRFLRAGRGQGAQTPPPRPAPPPPLSSSATKSLTDADHFGMIRTAQRCFAPTVIGITRNSDRHQIGMSDRHRRNTQQRPLASGAMLQGAEADIEDQNVCGDQRQCALKQTLKIKTFVGTSANAVRTQVWTALIAMLVLKYRQLKSKFSWSLSTLAALLRQQLLCYRDLWRSEEHTSE